MTPPLDHKPSPDGVAGDPSTTGSRFENLPGDVQEHFRREFQKEQEPGWLERHHAEIEERGRTGSRRLRKR
jgi:hypothetical protein